MTIDSNITSESFLINAARVYSYVIENSGISSITVYEVNAAGLKTTVLNYNNVLNGSGPPLWDGGTITFSSAHLAGTVSVEVERTTAITQLIDYQAYDAFPAETHEFGLDKLTMITQESRDFIDYLLGDPFGGSGGSPVNSPFVPLAGTQVNLPITGALIWDHDNTGPSWSQSQGDLYGINSMVFTATGVDSEMFITTVDTLGNSNQFRFSKDGELNIPSSLSGSEEYWVIKGVDFLGAENALSIYSFDNTTNLRTANPIILYTSTTEFFNHGEDGKILTSGVIGAGDDNQVLVTKLYVDGVVSGIGGLPSEVAGNVLVGTGAGWAVATGITLDNVTTPGQADLSVFGSVGFLNTHGSHTLESWDTTTGDLLGVNWLKLAPSTAAGAFSIYTDTALTEQFAFASGFLSLPNDPTAASHATNKSYVDAKLPAGGSLDDTLRWNGSNWLANSNLQIDSSGDVAISQALTVSTSITATGDMTAANVSSLGTVASVSLGTPGIVYSGAFGILTNVNPSDRNIKHDIEDLPYGLDEVMQLTPRQFVYNDGDGSLSYGFIAQEMREVLPEFVVEDGDHLGIKGDLVPMLVKAMQDMSDKVDSLEAKIVAMGGEL